MKKLFLLLCCFSLLQSYAHFPTTETDDRTKNFFRVGLAIRHAMSYSTAINKYILDTLPTSGVGSSNVKVSMAQLREISGATASSIILTNVNAVPGNWYYDPSDVNSSDDSATVIVTVDKKRIKRFIDKFVNVKWFGATGNGSVNDYYAVQKAINYVVYHPNNTLAFPPGTYKNATKGWLVWKDSNNDGNPEFVTIEMTGASTAYGGNLGNETTFIATFGDSFLLGIQKGKGCRVSNINFVGVNQLNYHQNYAVSFNPATTYNIGVRDNGQSPYSGIVLDPFGAATTGPNRYPGFESYYAGVVSNGGSTDCNVSNISINGFYLGIALTPNITTQNNEQHRFDNIWLSNCWAGMVVFQKQSRNIYCSNWKIWESVRTVIATAGIGYASGDCPIMENFNIAGGIYQFVNVAGYTLRAKEIYAELLYRLGMVGTEIAQFDNCQFDFADPSVLGNTFKYPDFLLETSTGVHFNNCHLLYLATGPDNKTPMNIYFTGSAASADFNNCYLSNELSDTHNTGYYSENIRYENCKFYNIPGSISSKPEVYYGQEYTNQVAVSSGNRFTNYGKEWTTYNPEYRRILTQARKATTAFVRYIDIGSYKITVSKNSATAPSNLTGGRYNYLNGEVVKVQLASFPLITPMAMRIDSIESNGTIHFNRIINSMVSGTYSLFFPIYSKINTPVIGSVTNGSATVSNVISEGKGAPVNIGANKIVLIDGQIYNTISSSAGSFTLGTKINFSNSRAIISTGLDYLEYGTAALRPDSAAGTNKILFTKGSRYSNTGGSNFGGWTVIKTGITNTSYLPEFSTY